MRLDPIHRAERTEASRQAERPAATPGFDAALRQAVEAGAPASQEVASGGRVEFSKHALARLEQRGIRLDDTLLGRLEGAVERAGQKGSRTTLVLVDDLAFVVGVPSRTVVTVADQQALKEKVFTNIDSMVIA